MDYLLLGTIAILNEKLSDLLSFSALSVLMRFLRRGTRRARIAAPLRLKTSVINLKMI